MELLENCIEPLAWLGFKLYAKFPIGPSGIVPLCAPLGRLGRLGALSAPAVKPEPPFEAVVEPVVEPLEPVAQLAALACIWLCRAGTKVAIAPPNAISEAAPAIFNANLPAIM